MFLPFKNAFYRFINYELPELAIQSVYADFEQILAVSNEMKQVQTKSEVDKKRYIQSLHIKNEQVATKLHEIHFEYEQQQFDRELEELLFYVKKRLFVRYDDFFKEAFSPANLRDDRGEKQKQTRPLFAGVVNVYFLRRNARSACDHFANRKIHRKINRRLASNDHYKATAL